jgi:hypothetical protein
MRFSRNRLDECCLCGDTKLLTGEHKIKASMLRNIFGKQTMIIQEGADSAKQRIAQSPKSSHFHFRAKICQECNTSRTQLPDREFVEFHKQALALYKSIKQPWRVMELEKYEYNSEAYINVFRYFAKLLACHIGHSEGPLIPQLTNFAIARSTRNIILLSISIDSLFEIAKEHDPAIQYAAHGGLLILFDKRKILPRGMRSSVSIGPIKYEFRIQFDLLVGLSLRLFHSKFTDKARMTLEA